MNDNKEYLIYVHNALVLAQPMNKKDAETLAQRFRDDGHTDVEVRKDEGDDNGV